MDKLFEEVAVPVRHTLEPPLKWAGGKRWLVPYLQALLGSFWKLESIYSWDVKQFNLSH
jgi:hypothetical protein